MRLIRGRASTAFVKDFSAKRERSAAAPLLGAACASGLGPRASGPPSPPLPSRSAPTELAQSLRSSSEIRPTLQFPAKTAILATSPSPRFLHQKVAMASDRRGFEELAVRAAFADEARAQGS